MKNQIWVFIAYYIYCIILVVGTGYIVFILGRSGWCFIVTSIFLNISPTISSSKNE